MRAGWDIAVVGGGIAGMSAALRLAERAPAGARVTVYEAAGVLGGKLRTGELAGAPVERGAEMFLTGDPAGGASAAVGLARRVGLGDALVHPATTRAGLVLHGRLVPIPAGTLMGVPADPAAVAAVARLDAARDRDGGRPLLRPDEDVAVGALVRARLGDAVVDRLVDPLLGGVYAGRADRLSLAATMPALARACRTESTLTGAARAALAASRRAPGAPVFATVAGGLGRLVAAVAAASGAAVRLGLPVRELHRRPGGWRLVLGPTPAPQAVTADAVVLAVPARPAARLLTAVAPTAAEAVGRLDYASVALVTLALPAPDLPELSGLLAPADAGTAVKAATLLGRKWAHLCRSDGLAIVRASLGRHGEERLLQRPDADLVDTAHTELCRLLGRPVPAPVESHVQRWGGALPQYSPGHGPRVAAARAALAAAHPTLALAGAGYDGIGIPACVRSGENAADAVLAGLAAAGPVVRRVDVLGGHDV